MAERGSTASAATERGVAADALEILQGDEREPEEGEELYADRQAAGGKPPVGEQARIEERVFLAELVKNEPCERNHASPQATEGAGAAPSDVGRLDDAEDEGHQSDHGEERTTFVQSGSVSC